MRSFSVILALVTAAFAAAIPVDVNGTITDSFSVSRDIDIHQHETLLYIFRWTQIPMLSILTLTRGSRTPTTTKNESWNSGLTEETRIFTLRGYTWEVGGWRV